MAEVQTRASNMKHVEWIDLAGNGVMIECAVLKKDSMGNIYYVEIPSLDSVDRNRIGRILSNRNAANFPLWDLMSQTTLNNGVNALEYFHQLVKVITADGVVMSPRMGTMGTGKRMLNKAPAQPAPAPTADAVPAAAQAPVTESVAPTAAPTATAPATKTGRRPGRPRKAK